VRCTYVVALTFIASIFALPASAQFFNNRTAIQGYLKQSSTPLNDPAGFPMRFIIKRNSTTVWCQTYGSNVPVVSGIFNTVLSGNSNCQSLTNSLSGNVFSHAADSDTFVFDVVVDMLKDGFGGPDDATFAGIDIVSTPLAIYASYANTALTAASATNATSATTATTAGNVTGIVAIANGGTGASSASAARTALGLGNISTINLSGSAGDFLKGDGTWANSSGFVTSITAGAGLSGGTITSTGTLSVDSTTAGASSKILQLDGSGVANMSGAGLKGASSGTLTLQPAATTSNYSLSFPAAQGSSGQFLSNDGSGNLSWTSPSTSADSSYAAKGLVRFNTDAATSGMSIASGIATVNFGTGANQILKLDGTSKIPAVNGSQLTNINAVQLQGRDMNSAAPTAGQVIAWNNTSAKWEATTPTAAVSTVTAGSGLLGGTITTTGTIDVDATTSGTSNKILQLDGSGIANMFGAALKGSTSGALTLQTAGVTTNYSLTFPGTQGASGQVLSNDGSGILSWVTPQNSDSSYSTKGLVRFNTDAATSGISVVSGVASVNSGSGANQIVKLDASSRLPAVDGSALTNISAGNVSTGILPLARGGTNAALTAANGGVVFSTASALAILAPGTSGQVLTSGGAGAPTWSTPVSLSAANSWSSVNTFSSGISSSSVTGASTLTLASTGANDLTLTPGSSGSVVVSAGQLKLPASGIVTSSSGGLTYTSSGDATFQSANDSTTIVGSSGSGATTTIQAGSGGINAEVNGTTGNVTIAAGTTNGAITIGNGSDGNTTIGNTGSTTTTTLQAGTGKVKIGATGSTFSSMGYCVVPLQVYLNNTPNSGTCAGVAGDTSVVNCSPSAAVAGGSTSRATGANTITFTVTATSFTGSLYCMYMNP